MNMIDLDFDLSALPWLPLDATAVSPKKPAIYFAIDDQGQVQYIGRSINVRNRWKQHHRYDDIAEIGVVKIAYLFSDVPEQLHDLESKLIKRFNPPLNAMYPKSSGYEWEEAELFTELLDESPFWRCITIHNYSNSSPEVKEFQMWASANAGRYYSVTGLRAQKSPVRTLSRLFSKLGILSNLVCSVVSQNKQERLYQLSGVDQPKCMSKLSSEQFQKLCRLMEYKPEDFSTPPIGESCNNDSTSLLCPSQYTRVGDKGKS